MWRRWQTEVCSVDDLYRPYFERCYAAYQNGGRKSVIKVLGEAPQIRPFKEGPVRLRDGVDYSIRYARIGGRFSFQEKLPWLLHLIHGNHFEGGLPSFVFCAHNCIETFTLTDEGCRLWTIAAEQHGVRYSGEYGYIFPGRRTKGKYALADFKVSKSRGEVPAGKRSRDAKLARAARRRAKKPVLRKGWTPLSIKEPLVVRPSSSAASIRAQWLGSGVTWRDYRDRSPRPVVLTLALPENNRTVVPPIVVSALQRIYSRVVLEEKGVISFPDHKIRDPEPLRAQSSVPLTESIRKGVQFPEPINGSFVKVLGGPTYGYHYPLYIASLKDGKWRLKEAQGL